MIYEVTATIFFDIEDEAKDFYHDCELALPKGTVINPHLEDQQCSKIELVQCFHDQDPSQPCETIARQDNCPE